MKIILMILLLVAGSVQASNQNHECQGGHNCNDAELGDIDIDIVANPDVDGDTIDVGVETGDVFTGVEGDTIAVDASPSLAISTNVPRQVPNSYFNYTPNFLNCGRVIGFQYGNSSGIGAAGIPWFRDRSCDIWLAVNEAQENGHVLLSYAFMCEIKNIKNVWGLERCNKLVGLAEEWWDASLGVDAAVAGK